MDLPLLALGTGAAVIGALAVGGREDVPLRAAAGALAVALSVVPFVLMRRLELALYAFVPLMTVVRMEPAPIDLMTVGLVAALAIRGELRKFVPNTLVLIGLLLLLLSYGAALLVSPSDSAMKYAGKTFLVVAMGYVAYQLAARERGIAERAFVLAALALVIQTLVALSPLPVADTLRRGFQVQALFKDPNVLGPFAVSGIVLLCVLWPRIPAPVRIAGLAAMLIPVVASFSRGAALTLVVSLLALATVAAFRRLHDILIRCLGILAVGAFGVAVALWLPGASLGERKITTLVQAYDSNRFAGQLAGVSHVVDHPLSLGIGPGRYEAVLGRPSHETYLRMVVETGALSLLALLILLWSAVRNIRSPDLAALAWAATLAGLVASGFFIDTLHWRHLWVVLGAALAIAPYRDGRTHPAKVLAI